MSKHAVGAFHRCKNTMRLLQGLMRVQSAAGGSKWWHTLGHVSVPQAIAATACAPPAFRMWVTPARLAHQRTSGVIEPSGLGGVASTMVLQPAMPAGTDSIKALDGSTAVPPGTYIPTAPVRICEPWGNKSSRNGLGVLHRISSAPLLTSKV